LLSTGAYPHLPANMNRDFPPRRTQTSRNRPYSAGTDRSAAGRPIERRTLVALRDADVGNAPPVPRRRRHTDRLSVGIDVASVAEVASAVRRFGDRYVRRVFTPAEAAYCRAATGAAAAQRFAARFAAKEAAVKVLQPDSPWSDWRAIEVRRHKSGRCALVLHGRAAALAAAHGFEHLAVSISHDGNHAAAIVVALRSGTITDLER
jgi:holo-[acyl-carrier protein] synthase